MKKRMIRTALSLALVLTALLSLTAISAVAADTAEPQAQEVTLSVCDHEYVDDAILTDPGYASIDDSQHYVFQYMGIKCRKCGDESKRIISTSKGIHNYVLGGVASDHHDGRTNYHVYEYYYICVYCRHISPNTVVVRENCTYPCRGSHLSVPVEIK